MSRISRAEVERIAHLARLRLDPAEVEDALPRARGHPRLRRAARRGRHPGRRATALVIPLATPLRDDAPAALLSPELAVANAPRARGTAFVVPRVLDDEAEG